MNPELLCCPICLDPYDINKNLPKIMPLCGHTICELCLASLLKNQVRARCPFDNQIFQVQNINEFLTNQTLREVLEESMQIEYCKLHDEKIRLTCSTDDKNICAHCALTTHKDHAVKPIRSVEQK